LEWNDEKLRADTGQKASFLLFQLLPIVVPSTDTTEISPPTNNMSVS
jgi:hypothetical protein